MIEKECKSLGGVYKVQTFGTLQKMLFIVESRIFGIYIPRDSF